MIAALLAAHGVERAVMSPGSRNVPLLVAMTHEPGIATEIVVDERSAAFMALGMASVSGRPVALVCTSGTALLNYAPAVAEAYYRHVPLIVVSADRPRRWIDQDDSQTIRQPGALSQFVKASYDLTAEADTADDEWYANRVINDAMINATSGCRGPVHINVQVNEPIGVMVDAEPRRERVIRSSGSGNVVDTSCMDSLREVVAGTSKVLVVAGFHDPDMRLESALQKISELPNVAVMTESIANMQGSRFINRIDTALGGLPTRVKERMAPELVITFGGALVSRFVKQFLREYRPAEHWHVGFTHTTVDCFKALTLRIESDPARFFENMSQIPPDSVRESQYAAGWLGIYADAVRRRDAFAASAPWSDLRAFSIIMHGIPAGAALQLSNGTPVRYGQLFAGASPNLYRVDCNRGTSGIDGSTSTAVGASLAYTGGPTVLISGDMSAQYDMGALAFRHIPLRFKMIVMDNGGGGIFRFIGSTSALPGREELFGDPVNFPIVRIAGAFGFDVFTASTPAELERTLPAFMAESERPAILAVEHLPKQESADLLKEYFTI